MDRYRFFVVGVKVGGVELPAEQGHHALDVLRLQSGEAVEVFDGKGTWGCGVIEVSKRGARVEVKEVGVSERPAVRLTIATAVPKGDRAEWLVEQASQLNVSVLQWVDAVRGVVKPREGGGKMEKFQKLAVESAKQCGRNWVMEVRGMRPVLEVAREAVFRGEAVWWMEQKGVGILEELGRVKGAGLGVTALIGPEGGWSEEEVAVLAGMEGVVRVRLGETVLRVETACAAVGAVVAQCEQKISQGPS